MDAVALDRQLEALAQIEQLIAQARGLVHFGARHPDEAAFAAVDQVLLRERPRLVEMKTQAQQRQRTDALLALTPLGRAVLDERKRTAKPSGVL